MRIPPGIEDNSHQPRSTITPTGIGMEVVVEDPPMKIPLGRKPEVEGGTTRLPAAGADRGEREAPGGDTELKIRNTWPG